MLQLIKGVLGSRNQRLLFGYQKSVKKINCLSPELQAMSDEVLKGKTSDFKKRLTAGETLDDLLPEAFALVREASQRTLGLRHYNVQLIGGMALHQGKVAEMCTGEGKTLSATLPVYLNALTGQGVHVITVNPYLAQRDAEWMRPLYEFLGLTVGVIVPDMPVDARQAAYQQDITYGTNNEFAFDYLRDNLVTHLNDRVQRELVYALIDEVDSVLIDEARTPLIISGEAEHETENYQQVAQLIDVFELGKEITNPDETKTTTGDFIIDEKEKTAYLTEQGHQKLEKELVALGVIDQQQTLYEHQIHWLNLVQTALRAKYCFKINVDYMIKDDQVVIIDEHTGRAMQGRRWSDGLHQAIEAKEGLKIQNENFTSAAITFQNYFRMYDKLGGMTGTAETESTELMKIYQLEVVVIPTHRPMQRQDLADRVYVTEQEKITAILQDINDHYHKGQPVLVGTVSIEQSEQLSRLLKAQKIPHQVLNAKRHAYEASIIEQAGRLKQVTIATNMAGRGTDIVLGGQVDDDGQTSSWRQEHDAVIALGGLHVIGCERHESRRIDNQLRGRSGRQGDPGSSQFYLSLEDPLMRIFASEWVQGLMRKLGMEPNENLEHPMLNRAISNAQRKVEGYYFDIRKQLIEFDDVANEQRALIYRQRLELLSAKQVMDQCYRMIESVIPHIIQDHQADQDVVDLETKQDLHRIFANEFGMRALSLDQVVRIDLVVAVAKEILDRKVKKYGESVMNQVGQYTILSHLDMAWRDHLSTMEHLRKTIHLQGYAQKHPIQEYKRQSFDLLQNMLFKIKRSVASQLLTIELEVKSEQSLPQSSWSGYQQTYSVDNDS
jgi:preprotein translocase subunit SecA